jgi:hypothetical protein
VTTISKLRDAIDFGLIHMSEVKGQVVRVGFMPLTVEEYELTPGDGMPNRWHLESSKGKKYIFTPYNGLQEV